MKSQTKREDWWPLVGGQDHYLMNRSGDLTACYLVQLPEIFSSSQEDYQRLHNAWAQGIRLFDEGTLIHQQDWYCLGRLGMDQRSEPSSPDGKGKTWGIEDELDHANARHFQGRRFLDHRCFLFISRLSTRLPGLGSSGFFRRSPLPASEIKDPKPFTDQCDRFRHWMEEQTEIKLRALRPEEIWSQPGSPGLIEQYLSIGDWGKASIGRDLLFSPELSLGSQRLALFSITEGEQMPGRCAPCRDYPPYSQEGHPYPLGFASPLGQLLPVSHIYNQFLHIGDASEQLQRLESRARRFEALRAYSAGNGLAQDAMQAFVKDTQEKDFLPVRAHFNLIAWSTQGQWDMLHREILAAFHKLGVRAQEETLAASRLYGCSFPGNGGTLAKEDTFEIHAEAALCFFNMETGSRDSSPVKGIRLADRKEGIPFRLDLSDEAMEKGLVRNRNKFILGPSGSGKSFFTNHMLRAYYDQGAHIVLVDVGHSYEGLCRYLQGYYFCYDPDRPMGFNPFYLGKQAVPDAAKLESLKNLLGCLWKKNQEDLDRSEYVALSELVSGFYQDPATQGQFPCFDRFYEYVDRRFSDPQQGEVREKDFDVQNFLFVLRPYYKGGEWDFLLNATEQLDWSQHRFLVFELDRVKDHPVLFGLVTLIIMDVFLTKMRSQKGERKIMLIEEAWKAIARQGMAAYMQYLFKTIRKHFGEAIVVTQEIEDLIHSPILHQAILQNSDCRIILDQSKYVNDFKPIARLLGLSAKDQTQILSLNRSLQPGDAYKEVFIALGPQWSRVYRVEVSLAEYYIYTTEENEKLMVQAYEREYGSLQKGIERLVADRRAGTIQQEMARVENNSMNSGGT